MIKARDWIYHTENARVLAPFPNVARVLQSAGGDVPPIWSEWLSRDAKGSAATLRYVTAVVTFASRRVTRRGVRRVE